MQVLMSMDVFDYFYQYEIWEEKVKERERIINEMKNKK